MASSQHRNTNCTVEIEQPSSKHRLIEGDAFLPGVTPSEGSVRQRDTGQQRYGLRAAVRRGNSEGYADHSGRTGNLLRDGVPAAFSFFIHR